MPSLVEIGQVVLENIFFVNVFSLFRNYLPLEKGGSFIWANLNSLLPRMLCTKFDWNWLSGSGGEDFKISSMYFCYFVIISPWKRAGPFICTNVNLNHLHPRMHCAKFGWNWLSGSGEEDENVKSLRQQQRQRRRTTNKFWSERLTWAKASSELKMKNFFLTIVRISLQSLCMEYVLYVAQFG